MASIALEGVTKRFDEVTAVHDVSLLIDDGEFMVLLGPSGCGKSTALRMIAGLETPDAGTVRIDGAVMNDVEAKERDVAMVFQSYALYPHMTVRRNIAFPLKPLGVSPAERDQRVQAAAEQLGLGELLDRKPAQLSGGQRQRVALARAIVRKPRAFLMDEPLSNLDAKLRAETRTELVELHERLGTTFVYVTHDQVEAMTMADRIAILVDGKLQQCGTPEEIYERPANLFVARFIGTPPTNTWPAMVKEGQLISNGVAVPMNGHRLADLEGAELVLGARAESIALGPVGLPGVAETVESLGHERLVTCRVGENRLIARLGHREQIPAPGEPVHIVVDPDELMLFDPDTGERLP